MAPLALVPHPTSPRSPLAACTVAVTRAGDGSLRAAFRLAGNLAELAIPALQPPARADRLWQHTCCEVFVGVEGSPAYREFNVAPSGAWAAYGFTGYRAGMTPLATTVAPGLAREASGDALVLGLALPPDLLPPPEARWRLGLAAVVEDRLGRLSYWALRHTDVKPDFHAPAGWLDATGLAAC
jgi:hypothetical protein